MTRQPQKGRSQERLRIQKRGKGPNLVGRNPCRREVFQAYHYSHQPPRAEGNAHAAARLDILEVRGDAVGKLASHGGVQRDSSESPHAGSI